MDKAVETPTEELLYQFVRKLRIPVSGLLSVTRRAIEDSQTVTNHELASFLETRAASRHERLACAAGDSLSPEEAASLLGISRAAVHKAKDEDRLLAYQQPGRRFFRFPTFQFEGGAPAPWVPELIRLVGNGFAALHYVTVERRSLDGKSFLDRLRSTSGKQKAAIVSAMLARGSKLSV